MSQHQMTYTDHLMRSIYNQCIRIHYSVQSITQTTTVPDSGNMQYSYTRNGSQLHRLKFIFQKQTYGQN